MLQVSVSTQPGREADREFLATDTKSRTVSVGSWLDELAVLSVNERAQPEHLEEILRSDYAARARMLQVAFNKKAAISALPVELPVLAHVRKVTAWRVQVGAALWTLPLLEELDLFDVGELLPIGRDAPALRKIKLAGGKSTALPEDLDRASGLETIELRDVGLKALPAALGRLRALHTLDVVGARKVRKLPDTMMSEALRKLVLQDFGSEKTEMPEWIATLPRLAQLSLGHIQRPAPAWLAEVIARVSYSGPMP